ncbi:MAG: HAMP domain-containing histidine kinase [Burkholderiaceae bacterium]|nr:HAMP domain-containing histidine kinase [Burkholderiaceae bacterium]
MTTSNTVFPEAVVSEVLNALLALTGLERAVLAVPDEAAWQIEQLAAGGQEVSDMTTDTDPTVIQQADAGFYDAVRLAAAIVSVPPVTGLGSHERISAILDSTRLPPKALVAVSLVDSQGVCLGVLCAFGDKAPSAYCAGTAESIGIFARSLISQAQRHGLSQRKVLSVISHDVRNPMHSLFAAIEMLKSKPLDPRALRLAGMVEASALRLGELARGAVDFARMQLTGEMPIHPVVNAPLQTALDKAVANARAAYPQREVTAHWEDCAAFTCDPARVGEAFAAVLNHALKHVEYDSTVAIRGYCDEDMAALIDIDVPGYILPAELLPHLFDPFHMIDGEARIAQLGIGLYLAAAVARAHGGSLTASALGEGAVRFTMRLAASVAQPRESVYKASVGTEEVADGPQEV